MIIALDVFYYDATAKCAAVIFDWADSAPQQVITTTVPSTEEYTPGEFYKRELPCLLKVLENVNLSQIELILVDGHVYTSNSLQYGLGAHLWQALHEQVPVGGVAKSKFAGNETTCVPVYRGKSENPLFVSAIGEDAGVVAQHIKNMHGAYRIPTILKMLDRLTKEDISVI